MNKTLAICIVGVYTLVGLYFIPSQKVDKASQEVCVSVNEDLSLEGKSLHID